MESREALERAHLTHELAEKGDFGRRAALVVSILAALLAIASVAAKNSSTKLIVSQERSSDAYNQYETNSIKEAVAENDAALLRILAAGTPREAEAQIRADALERLVREQFRPNKEAEAERVDRLERDVDLYTERYESFEIAEAILQLGIVLSSVAILLASRRMLWFAIGAGGIGLVLQVVGFVKPDLVNF